MKKNELVAMPGIKNLAELKARQNLIRELEELHKAQRGWQRMVNDEALDYEAIEKIPTNELYKIVKTLRG